MEFRPKAVFIISITAALTVGCGFAPQQSSFRTAFLPPAPPRTAEEVALDNPPLITPTNPYLHEVPSFLGANPAMSERRARADALVRRASQSLQRGRMFYAAKAYDSARMEFDGAVDLLLEASRVDPADRPEYARQLDAMVAAIHRYDLADLGAAAGSQEAEEKAPLEDILEMTFPVDPKLKGRVQAQVAATISQLPLSVNDAVLGYINYFTNRGHRTLVYGLERAGRYRPMIQRILDEEGVPQELIRLAQAESGFMPRAVSRQAARGMWQFLAERGRQYGLQRTAYVDERMDPEKATRAAARHLRDLYKEFGDWYLAIAAYNCGPVTVEKAVERTGHADFWELRRLGVLPRETTNYVPIILAMVIMEKNAAEYDIEDVDPDSPLEYDSVDIAAPTSMALVSDIIDTPLPELTALNPALLKSVAPEGYALRVPKGSGNQLIAALQIVPTEHRDAWRMHRVGPGETLAEIGNRYGAETSHILAVNGIASDEAVEGERLLIPAAGEKPAAARRSTRSSLKISAKSKSSSRPAAKSKTSSKTRTASSKKSKVTAAKRAPAKPIRKAANLTHTATR